MLSHKSVLGSLDAYADGTLPDPERARVAAHLQTCAECRGSLRQIHRLEHVLNELPAARPIPFSRFWSTLEPRLATHGRQRAPLFRPARLAAGFALAVAASLVGVVALASDRVMPDSPLYPVKHLRQSVQVDLAGSRERPRLELFLAGQRLDEALAMVQRKRTDLATASLRDMRDLLVDAAPRLENTTSGQPNTAEVTTTLDQLKTRLGAVSEAVAQDGPDPGDAAVDTAVQEAQKAVTQAETSVETNGPAGAESPAPSE